MITIATLGKFWGQPGYGVKMPKPTGGNYAGGEWDRKLPVVVIDAVRERDEKISVIVIGVNDD